MPEWAIDNLITVVRNYHADICEIINLEPSYANKPIRAIKLGKGSNPNRRGVLIMAGMHARELLNPDALIYFAFNLADAYANNTDLVLGGRTYTGNLIRLIINNMDVFILPLANPDGRAYVLAGHEMWRGNRARHPEIISDCDHDGINDEILDVDVNRNFDFLWNSGLYTSPDPCSFSQIYKGPAAFSEPETRNIRQLLESFPHISAMIDVHSFGNQIIYPWGDDEDQTVDPTMSFMNPSFDGQRGSKGDTYKEYIPQADLDWYLSMANKMREAIAAVRGENYSVIPGRDVYLTATSATSTDYSYSRHFVDSTKRKVFAFAMETGTSFKPPYSEATCVMEDIQPAFLELCIGILSASSELIESIRTVASHVNLSKTARRSARPSPAGNRYVKLLEQNQAELLELARKNTRLWRQSIVALYRVLPIVQSHQNTRPKVFNEQLVQKVDLLLSQLGEQGSPKLRRALQSIRQDLDCFAGKTMIDGLRTVDQSQRRKTKQSQ